MPFCTQSCYLVFSVVVAATKQHGLRFRAQTLHRGVSDLPDLPGDTAGSPQAGMPALLLSQVPEECGQGAGKEGSKESFVLSAGS